MKFNRSSIKIELDLLRKRYDDLFNRYIRLLNRDLLERIFRKGGTRMSKDFDGAQYPYFDRETHHKEDRGFIPGKGHPDIKKTWPNIPENPVTRPNPFLKKGE